LRFLTSRGRSIHQVRAVDLDAFVAQQIREVSTRTVVERCIAPVVSAVSPSESQGRPAARRHAPAASDCATYAAWVARHLLHTQPGITRSRPGGRPPRSYFITPSLRGWSDGHGQVTRRRFTNIWRKEGDTWRLFWRHANVLTPRCARANARETTETAERGRLCSEAGAV
jgi:hypothetical protein